MKKIIVVLSIFIFFLLGISIGNNNSKQSELFEEAKKEFENEIINPNNNYESKKLIPEQNIVNKIANKIDDIIETISDKIL